MNDLPEELLVKILGYAVQYGQITTTVCKQWARVVPCRVSISVFWAFLAKTNNVKLLDWLWYNGYQICFPTDYQAICWYAIQNNSLEVLEWMFEKSAPEDQVLYMIISYGNDPERKKVVDKLLRKLREKLNGF